MRQILENAGVESLQTILGREETNLIQLLNKEGKSSDGLVNLILNILPGDVLLGEQVSRTAILESMPRENAIELADKLGLVAVNDVYDALIGLRYPNGSKQRKILFEYLDVSQPLSEDKRDIPSTSIVKPEYGLFEHQHRAVAEVMNILQQKNARVMLHMPTGSGKTRCAMNAVTRYLNSESSKVVIWLTDQAELCEQAYDEFERCWQYQGTKPINIYRYWGDSDLNSLEDITEGIIIAGLQKLNPYAMKDISAFSRLGAHTGLIVMDEAHKAIAETYRFIIDGLAVDSDNTGILGLSATPGRTLEDIDRDGELSDFFNRTKVTLRVDGYEDPIDYLISEGYLADPVFESLTYEGGPDLSPQDIATIKDSPELPDQVIKRLTADSARNLLIVQKIKEMANRFDRILLFCLNVEHTKLMTAALQSVGINAQYVTGETPVSRRQTILNNFRSSAPDVQVICNFDVLTTGFDAPNCHAALIARPTSSLVLYLQMVGRVIRGRKQGGSDVAEIITVNDLNIGVFADIAKGFRNWEDVWDD